ncbi:hypothetical protein ES703_54147 [subsurface metagenome]
MNTYLTATDKEIEEGVNSPDIIGKGNINLYHPMTPSNTQRFWEDYHCDRCGKCCIGELFPRETGLVLANFESKRLAGIKEISVEEFNDKFTVIKNGRLLMKYPCPFYDMGCSIYQDRPGVCRLYPINLPIKAEDHHPQVDGTYLMTIDSFCPEARKVAIKWFKAMRDAYTLLISLKKDRYIDIENQVLANLEDVREQQKGVGKI